MGDRRRHPFAASRFADARHHTRLRHADFNLDAHLAQRIGHQARGTLLLKTELGMHVDLAAPGHQLLLHVPGFVQHCHNSVPWICLELK